LSEKVNLYGLELPAMEDFFISLGEKKYRAGQCAVRMYRKGALDFSEMTEFSAKLKTLLSERATLWLPKVIERQESRDGTVKLLLELSDGERVETVLIPDGERLTQCLSTQVGCAMGCRFCRTATAGLTRNLTPAEIVTQVVAAQLEGGFGKRVTNIVFMGMGEPLHNFEGTLKSFNILSSDYGLTIAKRRITVSTCGLAAKMKELPAEMLPSLALSLNATTDEVREKIMPVTRAHPISELIATLKALPLPARARYTIEYVLLGGLNDTMEDAARLVRLLSGVPSKINLIPYNPHGESDFAAPDPEQVERFKRYLLDKHFVAVTRKSKGDDILAACGQLKAENEERGGCAPNEERD